MTEEGFLTTSFSRQGLKDQKGGIRVLVRFFWVKQQPLKVAKLFILGRDSLFLFSYCFCDWVVWW